MLNDFVTSMADSPFVCVKVSVLGNLNGIVTGFCDNYFCIDYFGHAAFFSGVVLQGT